MRGLSSRVRMLWRSLRRRADFEADMDDEFRLHIELRTEDLMRSGLSPPEAARQARIEFGGVDWYKDEARASRGLRFADELRGETRYAARSLWRSRGFAVAAVLTIALGIGVNAWVFSLLSASLLRPLPFEEADRLVVLHQTHAAPGAESGPFRWWSPPQAAALQTRLTTFSHLAGYYAADVNLSGGDDDPVRTRMEIVSPGYFPALRTRPAAGRAFLAGENASPGAHPVTVLGHDLWVRRFGGDPEVIGSGVVVNGVPLTVVGVMPAEFRGLTGEAEMWTLHAMAPAVLFEDYLVSDQYFLGLVGRLAPDTPVEHAGAEVAAAGADAAAQVRAWGGAEEWPGEWGAGLQPLDAARRDPTTVRAQLVLAGAAVFVLLIAVVNLTGLLLARSSARARETGLRAALGAGRLRLVRHRLVEGGLLGLLGGACGALLAVWTVRALAAHAPEHLGGARPRMSRAGIATFAEPSLDWRVVAFAAALALAVGLAAALVAGLCDTRGGSTRAVKAGARASAAAVGSLRRPTLLSAAATLQVACALVLLVGAGMLLQGFHRLRSIDPGFEAAGLLTFAVSLPEGAYGGAAAAPLLQRVLDRVQAVPGVRSATVGCPPYERCAWTTLHIEGRQLPESAPSVGRHYVGPDHFRTLGVPLLRGRGLTVEDRAGRPGVAVIDQAAARRFWPDEDPIGQRVWFGTSGFASPDSAVEIVGVVGDVLYGAPGAEAGIGPDFYTSYLQYARAWRSLITVRAHGEPMALAPALRRAVAEVDPHLPIHDVQTLEERGAEALASERFATVALVAFAGLGLLLASVGVYGIMGYSVVQRRREIGIRFALGATRGGVLRLVVGQGAVLALVGLGVGTVAAVVFSRVLPALIAGVDSIDLVVFAIVSVFLLLVALFACYFPARSAMRVNPVETLATD